MPQKEDADRTYSVHFPPKLVLQILSLISWFMLSSNNFSHIFDSPPFSGLILFLLCRKSSSIYFDFSCASIFRMTKFFDRLISMCFDFSCASIFRMTKF